MIRQSLRFQKMLFAEVGPLVAIGILLFTAIVQLIDLFSNLPTYLSLGTDAGTVLYQQLLYLPKSIHLALPVGLLYGVSYTFGILRTRNEMLAVHASGVPLSNFILPLVVVGIALGPALFVFEDSLVIPLLRQKEALHSEIVSREQAAPVGEVQRLDQAGRIMYSARRFEPQNSRLVDPVVLVRSESGRLATRIEAAAAVWSDDLGLWEFSEASIYEFGDDGLVTWRSEQSYTSKLVAKPAEDFWVESGSIDRMQADEAWRWIRATENSGLPAATVKTRFYERYAFMVTPLIVIMLSIPLGSRIKKNIILVTLLASLAVAVVFYVFSMISGLLASLGFLDPVAGAWLGPSIFLVLAAALLVFVRN